MSVQSISLVLEHSRSERIARLVLIAIANHDGDGGSWPSIATIAREARTSERNAQRMIKELVDLGELAVHRNDGGTRHTRADRRPNRYEITIDPDAAPELLEEPTDPDDTEPDHGVTDTAPRGDRALSPEPSLTIPHPPTPPAVDQPAVVSTGCSRHPNGRPGCRTCGTTDRQLAAAALRAEEDRRRTEEQAAWRREREAAAQRRRAAKAAAATNVEIARAAIAESRAQARTGGTR